MFRQEALQHRNSVWKAKAILLPGIPLWCIVLSCFVFITFFIVFIISGSYTRRINVSAEVTTWPRPIVISTSQQGYVVRSYVKEGQKIRKGDRLYELDTSKTTRSGVVSDNEFNEITSQLHGIDEIIRNLEKGRDETLQSIKDQRNKYKEAYDISSSIVRTAEQGLQKMENNMRNYEQYRKIGLINNDQLTNQMSLYYQQENSVLSIKNQNIQNALQIKNLEREVQIQTSEYDSRIYQMKLQRNELKKELIKSGLNSSIIIRSPSDGIIDTLNVSQGQIVNAGDTLSQIIPERDRKLYLILWIPDMAVPYIKKGDHVRIRYDAFAYEKFGQFNGIIHSISKSPSSQQEMLSYHLLDNIKLFSGHAYYRVMVTPENDRIYYNKEEIHLENGMRAELTLFLENRKIYQWMISPLYDVVKSAQGNIHEK
ncbi:TPA: HlyD family secretion protein [Escherichia coli]|nr:HlyD family secretion protein [Escherichia coli]